MSVTKVVSDNAELALKQLFRAAIAKAFPAVTPVPEVLIGAGRGAFDYQCNNAMALAKAARKAPQEVAKLLTEALEPNDLIAATNASPQGFVELAIRGEWLGETATRVLGAGIQPPAVARQKVLVDFSSPNIAKEMHVGHLRSTIIGDCVCRLFEFCGHEVHRINHVGDWGTQFGMLILYLKQNYPDFLENPPVIADLAVFYKLAKAQFDADAAFKDAARLEVVKLQAYEPTSIKAWQIFCEASRKEFQEIYDRLGVRLEERGESFYNKLIPEVLEKLQAGGQLTVSDGAKIIVSTERKAAAALTAKDVAKLLSQHFVDVKKDETVEYHANLLAALRKVGALTAAAAAAAAADAAAAAPAPTEEMLQLTKAERKPWSKVNPQKDMDKIAVLLEPLFKAPAALDALLADVLRAKGALADDGTVAVPRFAFPLIAQKSDGAATYDTTDLAAMYHRFVVEKFDRVVYLTDVGQYEHFRMCAQVAEDMGWLAHATWAHAGFGVVTGEDGKRLKTRSGETTKLKDLLDEAKARALETLEEREKGDRAQGHTPEQMQTLARNIGYAAVKYFDLMRNRTSDYGFSFDKMLATEGNTAVFLLYQYARICSIKRKAGAADDASIAAAATALGAVNLTHPKERALALCALKFSGVVLKTCEDLYPHHLTDFAYELVGIFSSFFADCQVVGDAREKERLVLVALTGATLKKTLELLGIEAIERM